MCPRPHLSFCACKTKWLASEFIVTMDPSPHLWYLHAKQRLFDQNHKSLWAQTSPMVFCMQNSDFSIRITSLYGSQPSFSDFVCKTATLGSELQVSMCTRLRLLICVCKTLWLAPDSLVSKGPRPHLSFCACKTKWLASEFIVSMGPSPHLWFLLAKQQLLDQNYMPLWVPYLTYVFLHAKQRL